MARCGLCHNLEKEEDDLRLAFDFVPTQLLKSANGLNCVSCALILEGVLRFEDESWSFDKHVARIYAYCLESENDTLSLELYFNDDRPKLILEYFCRDKGCKGSESLKPFHFTPCSSLVPGPLIRSA